MKARLRKYFLRALAFLPLAVMIGWFYRTRAMASAQDREDKCASTVVAMKATTEDVRSAPPEGWPNGAHEDRSSRYPYLAAVLELAGCPETLATLRRGGEVLPSWANPKRHRR
jgi:hypothetical protein